jgi:hypothetical protein
MPRRASPPLLAERRARRLAVVAAARGVATPPPLASPPPVVATKGLWSRHAAAARLATVVAAVATRRLAPVIAAVVVAATVAACVAAARRCVSAVVAHLVTRRSHTVAVACRQVCRYRVIGTGRAPSPPSWSSLARPRPPLGDASARPSRRRVHRPLTGRVGRARPARNPPASVSSTADSSAATASGRRPGAPAGRHLRIVRASRRPRPRQPLPPSPPPARPPCLSVCLSVCLSHLYL